MRKDFLAYSLLLHVLVSSAAGAQETELDPVTVTASVNPLKASQTGRNIVVIKGERFAQLPVHSLDQLLRYLPGIELQARGPFGSQSDIALRGGTFQQVLVIVDGVRVNDANTGHFTANIPIAPGEIDRIEILKGASSALYGSDAVGGVINIITKTFAGKSAVQKLETAAQFTGGEYGFYGVNAGLYSSKGKTSVGGGILSNNTAGQPQRGVRGFVNATTVSASVGHRFTDKWSLAFRSAYDRRKFAAQNFYTSSAADTAQETLKTFWNQLQLLYGAANNALRLQLGYKSLQDSFAFNSSTPSNQNKTSLWQALLTNERKLGAKTTLTPGVQFINKKITSNDRGNHNVSLAAAFLMLNQQFGDNLFIAPAARLEWNERAGWEAVPQMALSYRASTFQLRGSAGKTIRDADFTERFNNYNKPLVAAGQRLGNPDLVAERSFSYEAGGDYFFSNAVKLSGSFFQRRHKNLIDYVLTAAAAIPHNANLVANGTYAFAKNIAAVTTTGYEADVQFSKSVSNNSNVWATLGLVWLHDESSSGMPSLYVSSHARFQSNFTASYVHKRFALSVNGLYKKRQQQKASSAAVVPVSSDYVLLNAKAEGFVIKNKLSAFAGVDNVLNRKYTDLLGAQMPGRWFTAGIKVALTSNE